MKPHPLISPLALLCNFALLYLLYFLCRVVYILEFWDIYSAGWSQLSLGSLLLLVGQLLSIQMLFFLMFCHNSIFNE